ncbi:MAG: hypothetical protein GY833_22900 [Aestuariibacter sp.]|mgnify:CR=1 FL=1|nr:hypothetical protein [Aestuariibacter sp.]|tara:strand:- start:193194 stop:193838 length:645 start_codon:yes stop_codon:yes gene_type:complete
MSRATQILERVSIISYDFDINKVLDDDGRPLPKKLLRDMERADKVELRNHGQELTGYRGNRIVFTAAGYVEDEGLDKGHFLMDSYFSKEFALSQTMTDGKLVANTINGDKFNEAYDEELKHKALKFKLVTDTEASISELLTKKQLDAVVTAHDLFDGNKREVYVNSYDKETRIGFSVAMNASLRLSGDDIKKLDKCGFKSIIKDNAGVSVYFDA